MNGPESLMAFGVVATGGYTVVILARAVARKIAGSGSADRHELDAMKDDVAQLRAELDEMRSRVGDLDELQNRVDFAERVIGQLKNKPVLPGGSH